MYRAELEETVIHLWKEGPGIRAYLLEGRHLPETFLQLGFAAKRLPETGLWDYVVLGGATLPAMHRRALFLEECCGSDTAAMIQIACLSLNIIGVRCEFADVAVSGVISHNRHLKSNPVMT